MKSITRQFAVHGLSSLDSGARGNRGVFWNHHNAVPDVVPFPLGVGILVVRGDHDAVADPGVLVDDGVANHGARSDADIGQPAWRAGDDCCRDSDGFPSHPCV